jgi:hypothetical protein
MDEMQYALLTEALGRWRADIIENFLRAEEIGVVLVDESSSEIPTTAFAPVKIYVPKESLTHARNLLKAFDEAEDNTKES